MNDTTKTWYADDDLAWSQEPTVSAEYHRNTHVVVWVVTILALAGLITLAITFLGHRPSTATRTPSVTTSSTVEAAPPPRPSFDTSLPKAEPIQPDSRFIAAVKAHGILQYVTDDQAIAGAHQICNVASQGYTTPQVISWLRDNNPKLDASDATFLVNLAEEVYCPTE